MLRIGLIAFPGQAVGSSPPDRRHGTIEGSLARMFHESGGRARNQPLFSGARAIERTGQVAKACEMGGFGHRWPRFSA